jgi:hypothetical protein
MKKLLARIGAKLGLWDYIAGRTDTQWWVVPRYKGGLSLELLEKLFPEDAVPF